jgi:hypothetical protein
MRALIPTLEWQVYAIAVVAVYTLGSASLAAHWVNGPGGAALGRRFLVTHSAVMLGTVALAADAIGLPVILPPALPAALGWTLLGGAAGHLAFVGNELALRHPIRGWRFPGIAITAVDPKAVVTPLLLTLVAALEEVLFRGCLVILAFRLPSAALVAAALALSVLAFAATHIHAGLAEALGKLPLGALTLALSLLSGTIWPPIVAHVYFNALATPAAAASRR